MSDLLPCPFCGGEPYTRETQDEDLSTHEIVTWKFVGCNNCDVSFGIPDGYDCGTAKEQWNTRADHVDALIAAALKVGSDKLRVYNGLMGHEAIRKVVDEIVATTPDEARQALDALLKAEREKALREAQSMVTMRIVQAAGGGENLLSPSDIWQGIEALISEDATDG